MKAMQRIGQTFRRPPTGRLRDRNGGLPRLSAKGADSVAHALRCPASPQRTLLAENLGRPSLWVSITVPWYQRITSAAQRVRRTWVAALRVPYRGLSGRRTPLTMGHIVCTFPPTRGTANAISMGHYQRSLVSVRTAPDTDLLPA